MSAFFHGNVTPEHHQPPMQSSGCNLFGRLPGEHGTLSTMPGRNHGQHVAIRHLTTENGIRSTAATHGSTSHHQNNATTGRTSSRPDITHGHTFPGSGYNHHQNAHGSSSEHAHVSRPSTTETNKRPGRVRTSRRPRSNCHQGIVPPSTPRPQRQHITMTVARRPRSNFHMATAATPLYAHVSRPTRPQRPPRSTAHMAKKSPHTGFSGVGVLPSSWIIQQSGRSLQAFLLQGHQLIYTLP